MDTAADFELPDNKGPTQWMTNQWRNQSKVMPNQKNVIKDNPYTNWKINEKNKSTLLQVQT